jgi:amidase
MLIEEATIVQLQEAMSTNQITARQLVVQYLERIATIDHAGPALSSVIEINPDAIAVAEMLDQERHAQGPRGPLHGIPILVKDNIATADQMKTTAGSLALLHAKVPRDAYVVQKLRASGAIILGKTNLSEWANFRSSHSSSGWSARGGQTRNPYALDRSPSGSSSGSGVAISANLAVAALGTETDGSVLSPSAVNGIVGLKVTLGLTSRAGVIPIAHSQDTVGPMARTVADVAALLSAIVGVDERDDATQASAGKFQSDYTQFLDANGLQNARIGVARSQYFGYSPQTDAIIETAIQHMQALGAVIIDPADIPMAKQMADSPSEFTVLLHEFKADLNRYLSELSDSTVHTLADIIAFNEAHAEQELRYFGQETQIQAQQTSGLDHPDYLTALAETQRLSRQEGLDAVMDHYQLDALIAPTSGPSWMIDHINGDAHNGGSSTQPTALSGYPAITVPVGFVAGMPVGISFMGRAWAEATLIRIAYAFEQATQHRQMPRFLPSID